MVEGQELLNVLDFMAKQDQRAGEKTHSSSENTNFSEPVRVNYDNLVDESVVRAMGREHFIAVEVEGLDEDGVFAFPVPVAGPEIKLVVGSFGIQIVNDGLVADSGAGFGQIEGDLAGDAVMAADDEHRLAFGLQLLPGGFDRLGRFGPAENAVGGVFN